MGYDVPGIDLEGHKDGSPRGPVCTLGTMLHPIGHQFSSSNRLRMWLYPRRISIKPLLKSNTLVSRYSALGFSQLARLV